MLKQRNVTGISVKLYSILMQRFDRPLLSFILSFPRNHLSSTRILSEDINFAGPLSANIKCINDYVDFTLHYVMVSNFLIKASFLLHIG